MKFIITGGAGFIGVNVALAFARENHEVVVLDNLSRVGCLNNLDFLRQCPGIEFVAGDVRHAHTLSKLLEDNLDCDVVIHLAAQTAVTTSINQPAEDFDINVLGTFNVLEAVRNSPINPLFIYASTNKVYGGLKDLVVESAETRYRFRDFPSGVSEECLLDFHSPYGCSKGAADQYVRDYTRTYGLRTVVLRQSCIYGYHQFGIEDQGWLAWLTLAAITGRGITIFGDGKQVRDILFIDDLIGLYKAVIEHSDAAVGNVYNIGGGPEFTTSIWTEFWPILADEIGGAAPEVTFRPWRTGDQLVYVSDISKASEDLRWMPIVSPRVGVAKLAGWISENVSLFRRLDLVD